MFEQYALSTAVALVIVMLVALVVLATRLESPDRRYHAYHVVALMGMTSVITACFVGLLVMLSIYGPAGKDCHRHGYDAVPASNQMGTHCGRSPEVAPSRTDANNAPSTCDGDAERQKL
jgi:hypothetical protein